ncbi:hypothetical protein N665_0255s0008 [Sinapis alba]|nr:hypothetical protein N665_0255s0008 [Sinapis alba]
MSPTTIPVITPGRKPVRGVRFVCCVVGLVTGFELIVFGIAAIAGVDVGESASEMVDGEEEMGHGFGVGSPHRPGFPVKKSDFWLRKTGDLGIEPVKLLKERSTVAFPGKLAPISGGISPESWLNERFK